jgi:hypothetical protein
MRHGLDFNLLWDRVNQFLRDIPERNSITFIITMNNLSITSLQNLFAAILGLDKSTVAPINEFGLILLYCVHLLGRVCNCYRKVMYTNLKSNKTWMQNNLETEATRFKGFKDYEVARLDRDIAWMRDGQKLDPAYINKNKADFYRFFARARTNAAQTS